MSFGTAWTLCQAGGARTSLAASSATNCGQFVHDCSDEVEDDIVYYEENPRADGDGAEEDLCDGQYRGN